MLRKLSPNRKTKTQRENQKPNRKTCPPKRLIKTNVNPNRKTNSSNDKSETEQEDLPWKRILTNNRKTETQMITLTFEKHKSKPNRKTCPRKETHSENCPPTETLTPQQEIKYPTERLALGKSLVKKVVSQQED